MTDPRAEDAEGDRSGRVEPGQVRPLSPHLQVWRFHVTMTASILNRFSAMGVVAALVLGVIWLACLWAGGECYETCMAVYGSWPGLIVWMGISWSAFYHLASGVRHLIWDAGRGFTLQTANLMSWASIGFSLGATTVLWVLLFRNGDVG